MRRTLPPHPHIDHLKKQAKALQRGHAAHEPAALDRIAAELPALTGRTREHIAAADFALHDAQSVIAREYGFPSWAELRRAVAAHSGNTFSEANTRMLMAMGSAPNFPAEVITAIRDADRDRAAQALSDPPPTRLPLIAVRDVVMLRPSVTPLVFARPFSIAAVQAAWQGSRLVATFSQRAFGDEQLTAEKLHPIGAYAYLHHIMPGASGTWFGVVEALRAVSLDSLEPADGQVSPTHPSPLYAHVRPFELDANADAEELAGLELRLRNHAQNFARSLPEPQVALNVIDGLDELELANAVVQSLPRPTADKALFAAEPKLIEKLRLAVSWCEALFAPVT